MGHFLIIIRPFSPEWPDLSQEMAHTAKEKKKPKLQIIYILSK